LAWQHFESEQHERRIKIRYNKCFKGTRIFSACEVCREEGEGRLLGE